MGLLYEPEGGGGVWTRVVSRWGGTAGAVCWAAAVAWLVALSHPTLNNRTYFSENALLPGLVRSDLPHDHLAERIYVELMNELQDKYSDSEEIPVSWLVGKMSQMHLDTYVHNFTLQYPLNAKQIWTGKNVYGVVRGTGLESILVSVPFRPLSSHLPSSAAGLALMLAFAHHARAQRYWAKDLIFLVTQHEQLGMQAWLEAYHASRDEPSWGETLAGLRSGPQPDREAARGGWLRAGELPARVGPIQAAINLDIPSPDIKYVVVRGEGLNGATCNLDLLNLVHRLCDKSYIPHSHTHTYTTSPTQKTYLHNLLLQILERATGAPSGNHGLVQRYGIEGVTLEGHTAARGAGEAARFGNAGWRRLLLVLEGTLRSLNNLLERFHQSYFLYLIVDSEHFVSIGQYMVVVCLTCVALLVRALSLCLARTPEDSPPAPECAPLLCNWLGAHAASLALMLAVEAAPAVGAWYGQRTEASVLAGAAAACALLAAACALTPAPRGTACVALVQLACVGVCVALLNPAAGLLLSVVYTPLALLMRERAGGYKRRLVAAGCVLLHPLLLTCAALVGYSLFSFPTDSTAAALARGLNAAAQAITFSLVDYRIYGNWTWTCWCWLLPVWSQMFQIATTTYPPPPPAKHKKTV